MNIDRRLYQGLDQLLWDFHEGEIPPQIAFQIYERRWAYLDPQILDSKEKALIKQLTQEYGNGIFMPSVTHG